MNLDKRDCIYILDFITIIFVKEFKKIGNGAFAKYIFIKNN